MKLSQLIPYEYVDSVYCIDYEKLKECGIDTLLFDIDNTLVHHGEDADERVIALFDRLKKKGFKTALVSDNSEQRVKGFADSVGSEYVASARKPDTAGYERALEMLNSEKAKAVVIGDRMFTDIYAANCFGVASILVHFITVPGEKWLGFKRYIEKIVLVYYRHSKKYFQRLGGVGRRENG